MPLGRSANLPNKPLLSLRSAQQRGGFSLCAGGRRQFHRGRPLIACTTARSCSALRSISAKTWGLSRNCSLLSHKTRLLFRASSHLFLPSPFQCAGQSLGLPVVRHFSALQPMRFGVVVVFSPPAVNSSGHRPLLPSVNRGFLCLPHGTKAENDNFEIHSRRIHPARHIFSFILIAHRQKSSTFATY